jgi:hypothetical protein
LVGKTARGIKLVTSKASLTPAQVEALLAGVNRKLVRAAMDWVCLEEASPAWTVPFRVAARFRLSTIKSLHKRGFLSANFDDLHIHDGYWKGVGSVDWMRGTRASGTPMVWTSALGREMLCARNLLPKEAIDNVVAFQSGVTKRMRCSHLRREAEIIDLASCRAIRNRAVA